MSSQRSKYDSVRIHAQNIGGIDETTVSFSSGITVLAGRNATNRTSFLQAIMAAMGSDQVSLKGDADTGSVEMTIGNETYTRTLTRTGSSVNMDGNPYLDDSTVADLFAFLLEDNEARRAVARDDELRELIMRPVDTEKIQSEIERLEDEKRRLDRELGELRSLESELSKLKSRRADLESEIAEKREELTLKEEELEEADTPVSESREEKEDLEKTLDDLKATRSELDDVRFQLETERDSLDALEGEKRELKAKRNDLPESAEGAIEEIDSEIETIRERRRDVDSTLNELQTIIEFNEEMLEGTSTEVLEALRDGEDETLTDQLLENDDTVTCWTCGSSVARSEIEGTLDSLQTLRKRRARERKEVSQRLDSLREERSDLERREDAREQVEQRLQQIEREREQRQSSIADLESRRTDLIEEIESLEELVDELESDVQSDVLDRHREANEVEFELDRLERTLDDVESQIESIESELAERDELQNRRESVQGELENQRTRIEQIEQGSVERFNDHMEDVLNILKYANLERIWIERTEREVRDGRRKSTKSSFDLHIVRSTDAGVTYEDTVNHLSESEREVTGLVFALAGYLVHDVHEIVPVMLLDSLEALDSERLADLVDYLREYTHFLVVALLPEDAAALDDRYERVTEI